MPNSAFRLEDSGQVSSHLLTLERPVATQGTLMVRSVELKWEAPTGAVDEGRIAFRPGKREYGSRTTAVRVTSGEEAPEEAPSFIPYCRLTVADVPSTGTSSTSTGTSSNRTSSSSGSTMSYSVTMKMHDIESHLPDVMDEYGQLRQFLNWIAHREHAVMNIIWAPLQSYLGL
jgi:hypothetical protein